jgi:hypothetical protein
VRIDPTLVRIRALIQAAVANPAVKASTISAAVLAPYIRIRTVLGHFFKTLFPSDSVSISDGQNYFAEDYVEPGYVAIPFYIRFTKVLSDTATVVEAFALRWSRGFTESVTMADTSTVTLGKAPSEILVLSDTATRDYTKTVSELAILADNAAKSFTKGLSEAPSLTDVVALSASLAIIEQPVASDSGSLRMQDYCAFDYFAEDYVGASRTFT